MSDQVWIVVILTYSLVLCVAGFVRLLGARHSLGHLWMWLLVLFVIQTAALISRGVMEGICPILGISSVWFFMAWALNGFYLLLGMQYRMSALGLYTAPMIALCMMGSWFTYGHEAPDVGSGWITWHAGAAMLAYGAFGLSAAASVVYLVQNYFLKRRRIIGISSRLPQVRALQVSIKRLLVVGIALLAVSVVFGFLSGMTIAVGKMIVSIFVIAAYVALTGIAYLSGMPGRVLAWCCLLLYVLSLLIFVFLK